MRSTGQRGELLVAGRLIGKGWSVAHPCGDTAPFDLLANKGERFLRIQVKSTLEKHKHNMSSHYQFQLAHGLSSKNDTPRVRWTFSSAAPWTPNGSVFRPSRRLP